MKKDPNRMLKDFSTIFDIFVVFGTDKVFMDLPAAEINIDR